METPKTVIIFSNGMVACFDHHGQQLPELQQKNLFGLFFEWLESKGIDPRDIKSIEGEVNGVVVRIMPYKDEQEKRWSFYTDIPKHPWA